jgi:hypothetical protein
MVALRGGEERVVYGRWKGEFFVKARALFI